MPVQILKNIRNNLPRWIWPVTRLYPYLKQPTEGNKMNIKFKKGDYVAIKNNTIASMMGMESVSGTIFSVREDNLGANIKCNETKAIETFDFNDGTWTYFPF